MEIDPTVTMDNWSYGQKANTPSITVKSVKVTLQIYDASVLPVRTTQMVAVQI